MDADSVEVTEEVDVFAEPEIDMESAQNELSEDLFGKSEEPEESELEESDEVEEIEEVETEEVEEEPEETEEKLERPQSWKKDMQTTWESMSKEAQEYVIHREEQMKAGLVQDRDDALLGRSMRDVLSPYSNVFRQAGVNETQIVSNLLNGHMAIVNADPQTRLTYFQQMARDYGIDLGGEQESVDPRILELQNKLNNVTNYINQTQQQTLAQTRDKIVSDVEKFSNEHEYFEELADDIAKLISAGFDLDSAYEKAYRASDYYAEKLRQETAEKIKAESKKNAEKAKQAKSVNVRSRDTGKAPTAPKGSIDDTLVEIYREINSRT